MRRSKTISLAEAVNDYIKEMNLGGKLSESSCHKFMGRNCWKSNKLQDNKNLYQGSYLICPSEFISCQK